MLADYGWRPKSDPQTHTCKNQNYCTINNVCEIVANFYIFRGLYVLISQGNWTCCFFLIMLFFGEPQYI